MRTSNGWADPNCFRDKSASSSQHPKRSSWRLCNEYGTNFLKKWLQHAACSIATDSTSPFNTSSLNVNPRVIFLHHQLVTLHS
ncbi:BZ3500_MvSof-1268-A1-R1_Chr2-2g04830 [Microbotryum saponariae]|uniref:BZ3500_MvSof-1268-A1-R1_Chr2-2g04830 protein n=1 Tax=Microbotryum saponariae TaxID=289078 RepID=A0A2X0M6X8_9BASI|nr:BZ3500_MvSof-1268-A1-R1_Chr2-2g04830 [Microbotryum saponariae]SDA00272.1 BZ3501_MvSof-1269-A2-R1_Chr2-2g04504 [Microbotryum saponariae]